MSYLNGAKQIKATMDANQSTVDLVNEAGGIKTSFTQSDKFGFDWKNIYVNNFLVQQEYIPQTVVKGTQDNPIEWFETVTLVSNACYTHDGIRKVWMGQNGTTASWNDENWAEF